MSDEEDFHKELRLKKQDAADFLRELADSIEDEDQVHLKGDDWQVYQPYENVVPFRLVKDEEGLEVDLKLIDPE